MSPREHFLNKKMLAGGPPFAAWGSVAKGLFGAADVFAQRAGRGRWATHAERRGKVRSVRLAIGVGRCARPHQEIVVTPFQQIFFVSKKRHYFSSLSLLSPPPRRWSALALTHPPSIFFLAGLHACPVGVDPGVDVLLWDLPKLPLDGFDELSLCRRSG